MFDVGHRSTFDCLGDWLIEMRSHLPHPSNMDNVVFAVCANKVSIVFFIRYHIAGKFPAIRYIHCMYIHVPMATPAGANKVSTRFEWVYVMITLTPSRQTQVVEK